MNVHHYDQPATMRELQAALARMGGEGYIVAGATDFLAQRNHSVWQAGSIISLSALDELRQVQLQGDTLHIGAAVSHSTLAAAVPLRQYFPALATACGNVGSVQIRNIGTIGGNVVNASPAGDTIPCLFLFGAQMELFNAQGQTRLLPVAEFLLGPGQTALAKDEILARIILPLPPQGWHSAFVKLGTRSKVTISQISLAAAWRRDGQGRVEQIRLWVGSISAKPLEISEAAAIFGGQEPGEAQALALSACLSELVERITPAHFDRDYKKLAVKGLAYDLCEAMGAQRI